MMGRGGEGGGRGGRKGGMEGDGEGERKIVWRGMEEEWMTEEG